MNITAMAGCAVCMALAAGNAALPLNPPRHGGVYVIAHRGAHDDGIPENTLPAYKKAIELGADFVERLGGDFQRYRDAVLGEQLLGLILVDVHFKN